MAVSIGKVAAPITKSIFAKHGFAYAEILANWTAIVGDEYKMFCLPDKIKWPKQDFRRQDWVENSFSSSKEYNVLDNGGILILRVASVVALELQYALPQLIERINAFYGYAAISQIKIKKDDNFIAPNLGKEIKKSISNVSNCSNIVAEILDGIEETPLKMALTKMGEYILSERD